MISELAFYHLYVCYQIELSKFTEITEYFSISIMKFDNFIKLINLTFMRTEKNKSIYLINDP